MEVCLFLRVAQNVKIRLPKLRALYSYPFVSLRVVFHLATSLVALGNVDSPRSGAALSWLCLSSLLSSIAESAMSAMFSSYWPIGSVILPPPLYPRGSIARPPQLYPWGLPIAHMYAFVFRKFLFLFCPMRLNRNDA